MSSVLVAGVPGECSRPPAPISPIVLELGFISNVTDPYKAPLSRLRNVAMAVSDMGLTIKEDFFVHLIELYVFDKK